jgi:exodeoxyribonuclease V gamma subunit
MCPDGIRSEPVPYEVVFELAQTRIVEVESEHGIYAENGIAVGSLSVLRSIPFRVTFMLGLGEADFPARAQRDPLDLRQAHRRAGDVSPAERDRYMFLETLLAARDRIFLSYIARDAQTGEALEPSAVVRDLQFILRGMVGSEACDRLTIVHPVSAHDRRYFADLALPQDGRDQRLETFDRNARHDAQMAALREDLESHCNPLPEVPSADGLMDQLGAVARSQIAPRLRIITPPPIVAILDESRVRLSLAALRHYLECPLQGAARHALGMSEDDDDDDADADEEPISRSRLDEAILLRDALWRAHGKRQNLADCYDEICRTRMLAGSSPIGPFAAADRTGDLSHLENAIAQAKDLGIPNLDRWQRVALGGTDEFAEVETSLDPIVLEVDFVRADGRRVTAIELRGRIGPVSPRMDRSFKLVARKDVKVADFLDGGFGAIALAAAGAKMPAEFMATVLGGEIKKKPNHTRTILMPSRAEARVYLTQLATDLLRAGNDYFLPIEAVEAVLRRRDGRDSAIVKAIRSVSGRQPPACKSDYGPVRYARSFRAPIDEIKSGLIERRFGPLMAILMPASEAE